MPLGRKRRAGNMLVGVDLRASHLRMIGLTVDGGGIELKHASVVDCPADDPGDVLRRAWRQVAPAALGAHCGLGASAVIVHQVEFPEMPADELRAAAQIEAEQLMPNIGEMVLDFQEISRFTDTEKGRSMVRTLLVAAPKADVDARWHLLSGADVEVLSIVPVGLALANAVTNLYSSDRGPVLALDIGQVETNLVAFCPQIEGSMPVVRHVPSGAHDLQGAGIAATGQLADSGDEHSERWLREVERSIGFAAEKLGARAEQVVVVGEHAQSSQLQEWIAHSLQLPVGPWNPVAGLQRAPGAPEEEYIQSYGAESATATGLALMEQE